MPSRSAGGALHDAPPALIPRVNGDSRGVEKALMAGFPFTGAAIFALFQRKLLGMFMGFGLWVLFASVVTSLTR